MKAKFYHTSYKNEKQNSWSLW